MTDGELEMSAVPSVLMSVIILEILEYMYSINLGKYQYYIFEHLLINKKSQISVSS